MLNILVAGWWLTFMLNMKISECRLTDLKYKCIRIVYKFDETVTLGADPTLDFDFNPTINRLHEAEACLAFFKNLFAMASSQRL